jgi:beta-glucanase (GH16 family)
VTSPSSGRLAGPPPGRGWQLTFADDFAGSSLDKNRWHRGWACGSGQPDTCFFYSRQGTAYPDANTTVSDGKLRLTTKQEQVGADRYTSGAITTAGRFAQSYGYFEVRMKPAALPGGDPAFWLASPRSWPPEIDIAEFGGAHRGRIVGNPILHSIGGTERSNIARAPGRTSFNNGWHTFALLWEPGRLVGYIDGKKTGELSGPTPGEKLFLIISDEVNADGGAWFGDPADGLETRTSQIDWVRVWQRR